MNGEPERTGNRFLDVCVALLLGAMALYGAVQIIQAIWVWLCILVAIVGTAALTWKLLYTRYRGW